MTQIADQATHQILTQEQVNAFSRDGYLVQKGVFRASEVCEALDALEDVWAKVDPKKEDPALHWRDHETKGRIADRLDPISPRSQVIEDMANHPGLIGCAMGAIGGAVCLLKDKVIMKWPGTAGYKPHQDYAYWQTLGLPSDQMVILMVALKDIGEENGAVVVWPGCHRDGLLPAPDSDDKDVDVNALEGREKRSVLMNAGDVLIFDSLLPHCSGYNTTPEPRTTLFFTFGGAIYAHLRAEYYSDPDRFFAKALTPGRNA